jgi:hypothetical protein
MVSTADWSLIASHLFWMQKQLQGSLCQFQFQFQSCSSRLVSPRAIQGLEPAKEAYPKRYKKQILKKKKNEKKRL